MGPNGHHVTPPSTPEQELLQRVQRSPVVVLFALLGGIGLGGAGGYGAARVEQVQRQPAPAVPSTAPATPSPAPTIRVRPLIVADKACSPPCSKKQTCYKGTCVDVATSVQQRLQVLEDQVHRLAGGDEALSAGAMR